MSSRSNSGIKYKTNDLEDSPPVKKKRNVSSVKELFDNGMLVCVELEDEPKTKDVSNSCVVKSVDVKKIVKECNTPVNVKATELVITVPPPSQIPISRTSQRSLLTDDSNDDKDCSNSSVIRNMNSNMMYTSSGTSSTDPVVLSASFDNHLLYATTENETHGTTYDLSSSHSESQQTYLDMPSVEAETSFDFQSKIKVKYLDENCQIVEGYAHGRGISPTEVMVSFNTSSGGRRKSISLAVLADFNRDVPELKHYLPKMYEISSQDSMKDMVLQLPVTPDSKTTESRKYGDIYVYKSHEFHYLRDSRGKERLLLDIDFFSDQCYAFRTSNVHAIKKKFTCLGCHQFGSSESCIATIDYRKKEVHVKREHLCNQKYVYSEQMNDLLDPQLIIGKPFDLERYGMDKYVKGQFERRLFYDSKKMIKRLFLFIDEIHELCYEFAWDETNKIFKCDGCLFDKHRRRSLFAFTRKDDEGQIVFSRKGHVCAPRNYKEIVERFEMKQTQMALVGSHDFEFIERLVGKEKKEYLVIKHRLDKSMCYVYTKFDKRFKCLGCESRLTVAKWLSDDGVRYLIADVRHVCKARDYKKVVFIQEKIDEELELCEMTTIIYRQRPKNQLNIYTDSSKRIGYIFSYSKNCWYCRGCRRTNVNTKIYVAETDGIIQTVTRYGKHLCQPIVIFIPPIPKSPVYSNVDWMVTPKGLQALTWLKSIFDKFVRGSCSMCAAYFLSTAPPTANATTILGNKFYSGFSALWLQRASAHSKHWKEIFDVFGRIWLYPYLIDESIVCEEMEALCIALFKAGSFPELAIQNRKRERFNLFDFERGVFILEEIATNQKHPDHEKLVLAVKTYLLIASGSESFRKNAVEVREIEYRAQNNVSQPISYWKN